MDVNSPETWRWIWLIAVVVFALAEVFTPFLFFMLAEMLREPSGDGEKRAVDREPAEPGAS